MQARPMRLSRLLSHHFMQTPDDGPPRCRSQRHPQAEGVGRRSVCGRAGIEVMQNARSQRRKDIVASPANAHAGATTTRPIQGLQASLQRLQSVRLRMNVLHMFLCALIPGGSQAEAAADASFFRFQMVFWTTYPAMVRNFRFETRCNSGGPTPPRSSKPPRSDLRSSLTWAFGK